MTILGTRAVLVVDDDPAVRETIGNLLKTSGYQADLAANGHEALARLMATDFEVVLLDIRMPDITGLDLLPKIREAHPEAAVIMFTGVDDVSSAVEAMQQGASDYITKPVRLQELLVRIEKAREKRSLALQLKDYQRTLEERIAAQAKELRQMMSQTVNALIKEAAASQEIQSLGGRRKPGRSKGTDIKRFGADILKRFKSGE